MTQKRPLLEGLVAKANAERRIVIDHAIVICNGCRGERTVYPDVPLYGAEEITAWLKTALTRCACGATTCDTKLHVANPEVLEEDTRR